LAVTAIAQVSAATVAMAGMDDAAANLNAATSAAPVHVAVEALGWDGDWPTLAQALAVRGVVQQLAQQSEMLHAEVQGVAVCLHLQVAIDTLRSGATVDKLAATLSEHFSRTVRIETRLGPVRYSANQVLLAERAERQRQAEQTMRSDPFVQTLMREFGASIVPGSIKPLPLN
jgi:DNA polymerase-3 subunit gamma/tau